MILKLLSIIFLKFFIEAVFTGKEITKSYFFLIIDADNFQITAGGDYSVPAVGHHGELKYPVRQPQKEAVSVVSYELVIQII